LLIWSLLLVIVGVFAELFNLALGFDLDDINRAVGANLATGHADVGPLQVIQRDRISDIGPQLLTNGVQGKLGSGLELEVSQAERRIHQPCEDRNELLFVDRDDVGAKVLAQQVRHVGQGVVQVSLRAQHVGRLLSFLWRGGGRWRFPRLRLGLLGFDNQLLIVGNQIVHPFACKQGVGWAHADGEPAHVP
jgi:hypothetical protein